MCMCVRVMYVVYVVCGPGRRRGVEWVWAHGGVGYEAGVDCWRRLWLSGATAPGLSAVSRLTMPFWASSPARAGLIYVLLCMYYVGRTYTTHAARTS